MMVSVIFAYLLAGLTVIEAFRAMNAGGRSMYTRNNRVHMNLESKDFINEGRTLKRYVELKNRPPAVRVLRKRMELQFAVQLMRNSYNAMDTLDFTPTDVFQRLQFLFRQNEWELYKKDHEAIM